MHDAVNHPSHYTDGKIEVIDYIEDKQLGYHLGNAVKYISRAGKKDPSKTTEDLKKAIWYIDRKIKKLESETDIIHQRMIEDSRVEAEQRETHEELVKKAFDRVESFCCRRSCDGCPLGVAKREKNLMCADFCRQHPQLALDLMEGKVVEQMELSIIERSGHTKIKVPVKQYAAFKSMIQAYITLHGGQETKRNSKFVYFEIYADLLNKKAGE